MTILGFEPAAAIWSTEIAAGGVTNQGSFADGASVQEVINAVDRSVRERRWIDLPLPR